MNITTSNTDTIADDYFDLWKTTEDNTRHALAQKLFAPDAVQYVVPANVQLEGRDAIEANIARVNKENIQAAGLTFATGPSTVNHDAIQLEWSVQAADKTVGTGRDFLLLNDEGQIVALYMFMGQ